MTDPFAKVPHAVAPSGKREILPAHIAGATWAWAVMIAFQGLDAGSATARLVRLSGITF